MHTRRTFIRRGALGAGALAIATTGPRVAFGADGGGYGPLQPDPGGLLDLPAGFRHRVLQTSDDRLSNGEPVPDHFDGMAAFAGPKGSTILRATTSCARPTPRRRRPWWAPARTGRTASAARPGCSSAPTASSELAGPTFSPTARRSS